jgi:hypothetical protein
MTEHSRLFRRIDPNSKQTLSRPHAARDQRIADEPIGD